MPNQEDKGNYLAYSTVFVVFVYYGIHAFHAFCVCDILG